MAVDGIYRFLGGSSHTSLCIQQFVGTTNYVRETCLLLLLYPAKVTGGVALLK